MIGYLRADLIRLRGRWDFWIVGLGVPILAAVGFIQGYLNVPNRYGWDPSQSIPDVVSALIAAERATYAFPHSILTLLGSTPWILGAVFYLASTTIGLEFGWGTIRTALLASPDRRRFLASRLIVLGVVGMLLLASLGLLAVVLPEGLAATGNPPPASADLQPTQILGGAAGSVAAIGFALMLAALLAILTRNPALPFLIGLVYPILEGIVVSSNQWRDLHLELVRDSLPFASVSSLLRDSLNPARYGLDPPAVASDVVDRPLALSVLIVVGWAALFYVIANVVLRRADVTE